MGLAQMESFSVFIIFGYLFSENCVSGNMSASYYDVRIVVIEVNLTLPVGQVWRTFTVNVVTQFDTILHLMLHKRVIFATT